MQGRGGTLARSPESLNVARPCSAECSVYFLQELGGGGGLMQADVDLCFIKSMSKLTDFDDVLGSH